MLLQPTSPLRTADDIVDAYRELEEKEADSIVSVCEAEHSPLLANVLPEDMSLKNFLNQNSNRRRQELAQYYRLNGAIYLSTVDSFLKNEDLFNTNCYALIMDKTHSVDIDDEYDFIVAEAILSKQDGRLL